MSRGNGKITLAGEDKINATEIYRTFGRKEFTVMDYYKRTQCHPNTARGIIKRLEGAKHIHKRYDPQHSRNVYWIPENTEQKLGVVQ